MWQQLWQKLSIFQLNNILLASQLLVELFLKLNTKLNMQYCALQIWTFKQSEQPLFPGAVGFVRIHCTTSVALKMGKIWMQHSWKFHPFSMQPSWWYLSHVSPLSSCCSQLIPHSSVVDWKHSASAATGLPVANATNKFVFYV